MPAAPQGTCVFRDCGEESASSLPARGLRGRDKGRAESEGLVLTEAEIVISSGSGTEEE